VKSADRLDANAEHPARAVSAAPAPKPRSYLFAVRLWKENVTGGAEYRGNVRDAMGGEFRNFRDWSELTAFMCAHIEEDERTRARISDDTTDSIVIKLEAPHDPDG
jgi:hypothetical protein